MTDPNGNPEPASENSSAESEDQLEEGSLISHLIELRSRLVKACVSVLVVFICLVPFAQQIFSMVADPLIDQLPEGSSMIATQVASPFLTPFKTTLFVALFFAMPVVIHQAWAFVAPGLYRKEKSFAIPLVVSSIVLFYLGIAFAYFVVFPLMFAFFTSVTPEGVQMMTDISSYLDFILTIFLRVRYRVRGADRNRHARRDGNDDTGQPQEKAPVCISRRIRGWYVSNAAGRDLTNAARGPDLRAVRSRHSVVATDAARQDRRRCRRGQTGMIIDARRLTRQQKGPR